MTGRSQNAPHCDNSANKSINIDTMATSHSQSDEQVDMTKHSKQTLHGYLGMEYFPDSDFKPVSCPQR